MDPQMVWDAMDEEDEASTSLSQVIAPATFQDEVLKTPEKKASRSSTGWVGFPMYGAGR